MVNPRLSVHMKRASSSKKKLQEILTNKDFNALTAFDDPTSWDGFLTQERELLAELFVMKADEFLQKGDPKAIEFFEKAAKIAPGSAKILFQIGKAYSTQEQNPSPLKAATRFFEESLKLDPNNYDAYLEWGKVLSKLGALLHEGQYIQDYNEKLLEAGKFIDHLAPERQKDYYWQLGLSFYFLGKCSGEALDYHLALEKFRKAIELGIDHAEFWKDYGDVNFELAGLIHRFDLYLEAADHYQKAVKLSPDYFEGWLSIGISYYFLYDLTHELHYFETADTSFENAVKLNDSYPNAWLKWAQLYFSWGKQNYDVETLEESFEKFQNADSLEPNSPTILSRWGAALMACGIYSERIDFLRDAEQKFIVCLELEPENFEIWHLYGSCLTEQGRYFGDEQYYYQAIDKFQHGLSINRKYAPLWHSLALAHFAIGELTADLVMVEKASRLCSKTLECGLNQPTPFWNDWGITLMKLAEMTNDKGFVESAIEKFERAINQFKNSNPETENLDPELLYNYGCALDFLGDFYEEPIYYEKAIQVLSKALHIEPNYVHARYNLALAYSHLGELAADLECFSKAIEQFQTLLSHDSEDDMAWNEYGLTLLNMAHLVHDQCIPDKSKSYFEQAEAKFMRAMSLGCLQSYYNLACLNSLSGNLDVAMYYMEKAESSGSLPALEDIMHDEWLEALRNTNAFRVFINHISTKEKKFEK